MGHIFLEGFLLQASLIFALGAQNLFVLESGLYRRHHLIVSFVCFLCDLSIIMLGVLGTAALFNTYPEIKISFGVIGIAFLLFYGLSKIWSKEAETRATSAEVAQHTLASSVLKAISFSIINPHAYLDGIVLIGGYSTKYEALDQRLAVGLGAATFSLVWFLMLSSASSTMMPLLNNPRRMKFAMNTAGIVLVFLSLKLGHDVYGWVEEAIAIEPPVALQVEQ